MKFTTINPATEETIKEYETIDKKEALAVAQEVNNSFSHWKSISIQEREHHLKTLAFILRKNKQHYAELMTAEMGKPITQALAEIEKCAWLAEYYAENAHLFLKEEVIQTDAKKSFIRFDPLGTILCIMPWNFPFWQAIRFAVPAMAAGNTIVLRHSNIVPECASAIESAFQEAGFPANVFRTIITDHDAIPTLIKSSFIQGVSLTGSTKAGARVAQLAAKNLKKCVLELGGSDPFIVLDDADINAAAQHAVIGRLINAGQSCIAAKRCIVVKSRVDEFTELFVKYTHAQRVGDPLNTQTQVGPIVREAQLNELETQVADAVKKGGTILTGGKRREGKGFFYLPTIITNTKASMKIVKNEVFGPVAPIIIAKDEADAVRIANSSEFGLGASIWTQDQAKAERLAQQIESGVVFINSTVKSDPRMPFGGVKKSGIGRELSSYGIKEFVNIKGVTIY